MNIMAISKMQIAFEKLHVAYLIKGIIFIKSKFYNESYRDENIFYKFIHPYIVFQYITSVTISKYIRLFIITKSIDPIYFKTNINIFSYW